MAANASTNSQFGNRLRAAEVPCRGDPGYLSAPISFERGYRPIVCLDSRIVCLVGEAQATSYRRLLTGIGPVKTPPGVSEAALLGVTFLGVRCRAASSLALSRLRRVPHCEGRGLPAPCVYLPGFCRARSSSFTKPAPSLISPFTLMTFPFLFVRTCDKPMREEVICS